MRPAAFALMLALVPACGDEASDRGEGGNGSAATKGDNLDENTSTSAGDDMPPSDHHAAVLECEALADHARAHTSDARTDALVDLERARNDCLVTADDAAQAPIEAILSASSDSWAGDTKALWDKQRGTAVATCTALTGASADDRGSLVSASCVALAELHFAEILDAYVDFGGVPFTIANARDRYPDCYAAYDEAQASAPGLDPVTEGVEADEGLAACIGSVHEAIASELAARVVAADPTKDAATVTSEIHTALSDRTSAASKVCIVAAHAGVDRDQPELDLQRADCLVDSAILTGEVIALVAPDLLPEADSDPTTGGTEDGATDTSGAATDGGESSSTTWY